MTLMNNYSAFRLLRFLHKYSHLFNSCFSDLMALLKKVFDFSRSGDVAVGAAHLMIVVSENNRLSHVLMG